MHVRSRHDFIKGLKRFSIGTSKAEGHRNGSATQASNCGKKIVQEVKGCTVMASMSAGQKSIPELDVSEMLRRLKESFQPMTHCCLSDVTDGHTVEGAKDGRALVAGSREYLLLIVSDAFDKVKMVERHRRVNTVFKDYFISGKLHALQLRTWTKRQWEKKGSPTSVKDDTPCCLDLDREHVE